MYQWNRRLHALAAVLALAAFLQAQIELADVDPQWAVRFHYDDRRHPHQEHVNVAPVDWRLALATFPTLLHHLYMAWPSHDDAWWNRYCRGRVSLLRWLEYSITSTAMTTRIAVLSGVNDLATLIALATLSITMIGLGGVHEWLYRPASPAAERSPSSRVGWRLLKTSAAEPDESLGRLTRWPHRLADSLFAASSVLFVVQWSILLATFERGIASNGDVPSWVVAVFVGLVLLDLGFPVVAWLNARGAPPPRYSRIDASYALLSLTVKQFYMQMLLYGYRSYARDT